MSISATTMHMLRALGVADPITSPTIISAFTWDKSTADNSAHRTAIWLDSNDAAVPDTGFQFGTDGNDGYAVRIARGGTIEIFEETVNYWWQGGNRNTWKGAIGYLNGPAAAGDAGVFWHDATERTKAQDITGGNINATLADLYVLRNRLAKGGWGGGADNVQPNLRKAMVAVWVGYKLTDSDRTALIGGAGVNTISPGNLKYVFSFGRSADDSATCLISGVTLTPVGDAATITWHDADNPTAWVLEPTARSVTEGATATFEVRALHAGTPTYQWQREPAGGGGFTNISGATSRTYTGAATLLANNGDQFRCVLNPGTGTEKISRAVTLTVTAGAANPVLSSPTVVSTGNGVATVRVTTDTAPSGSSTLAVRTRAAAAPAWTATEVLASPTATITSGASGARDFNLTGLVNGTALVADFAQTGPSNVVSTASFTPSTVPGAPTIGTAVAGNAQATVNGTAPGSTGGSAITGYRSTATPGGSTVTGASLPITHTGLANGTAYTFTLAAQNANGYGAESAASNSVTPTSGADTTPPTLTGTVTIGSVTSTSATASWPTGTDNVAVTGYEYRINGGSYTSVGTSTSVNLTVLTPSTAYTVDVRAFDAAGNRSTPAITGSFNTLAGSPPPPPSGHDVGPIFNNTYTVPLEGVTAHFTWYPNGRIGSLGGITPTEGTGVVGSDGMLAIAPSGAGCVFVTKRNTSAVDDDVFYQAFAS